MPAPNKPRAAEPPPTEWETTVAQLLRVVRAIPVGKVMSYGAVGAACEPPISGYICGRVMNNVEGDVPWWRVVSKDGTLPVAKRNPTIAARQRDKLKTEGITFDDSGRVNMEKHALNS